MVISMIDYGNMFLTGCNADDLGDLDVIQNHALRCTFDVKMKKIWIYLRTIIIRDMLQNNIMAI